MNILLMIDALGCGGAETHVCTLALALAKEGHRVTVLSEGGAMERELEKGKVRVAHLATSIRTAHPVCWARLVRFVCRLCRAERFDVIHAHTRRTALLLRLCRLFALAPPLSAAYRKRTLARLVAPVAVVTAHAKFAPRHRRLSFWGDVTVAVSEDLAAHTAQCFGVPRTRIKVIPNGIDPGRFCPPDRASHINANTLRITFASRLDRDCSAAAFALLSLAETWRVRLERAGLALAIDLAGGGECLDELGRRAAQLPYVRLLGNVERMPDVLRATDVLIGVSRVALEGAACGCAVILAGNEGARGLLTEQNFALCAKDNFSCRGAPLAENDPQGCMERMLDRALDELLATPPHERRAMTARLRARVASECGDERMAADTLALYRQALTARRRVTLLIGGYAGCGNLGDDAVLRCLCTRWQAKAVPRDLLGGETLALDFATLRVEALSGRQTSGLPLLCHDRRHPIKALRGADAFVLGGGALLQNCSRHGNRSLAYYLLLAAIAHLAGRPWYLVGGAGPIRGRLARALAAPVVKTAHGALVRDTPSRELLKALGLPPDRIRDEQDPVCAVAPASGEESERLLRRLSLGGKIDRLICVAPNGRTSSTRAIARHLSRIPTAFPLFFAFDRHEDSPLCRRLCRMCGGAVFPMESLDGTDRPEAYLAAVFALARTHGVLAGRLHALILASVAGVPAIPLDSTNQDPKTAAFVRERGAGRSGREERPGAGNS